MKVASPSLLYPPSLPVLYQRLNTRVVAEGIKVLEFEARGVPIIVAILLT
jgi:hypothetical protein